MFLSSSLADIFLIWFTVLLIGLINYPVCILIFRSFSDKGYAISKYFGLVVISYITFLLATLKIIPFYLSSLIFVIIIWLIFNVYLLLRFKLYKKLPLKEILIDEVIFLILFLFWTVIRLSRQEIYQIERFMDFGIIQTILNSKYLPVEDFWMSGTSLNYYYFGHFMSSVLIKLSNVTTVSGFYLIGSFLFASLGVMVYRLASEITNFLSIHVNKILKVLSGTLSVLFVLFAGNIGTAVNLFLGKDFWYPQATRLIPGTITEMPFYSFLMADLHAHVWGLLNGSLVLGYIFTLWKGNILNLYKIVPLGILIGIASITNTWDTLTLGILSISLLTLIQLNIKKVTFESVSKLVSIYFVVLVTIFIIMLPWLIFYRTPVNGLGWVLQHSPISLWLAFWGQFIIIYILYLASIFKNIKKHWFDHGLIVATILISFTLLFLSEIIYMKDVLEGGDWYRANTVFKITSQVWLWLGILSGPAFVWLIQGKLNTFRIITILLLLLTFLGSMVYPVKANKQVLLEKFEPKSLQSGLNWWKKSYPDDFKAYLYLHKVKVALPEGFRKKVILEAEGESYTDTSRFSTFLGWPTVAGWSVHQWAWRGSYDAIGKRGMEVREIYMGKDPKTAINLLQKYKVDYIVVGKVERSRYKEWLNSEKLLQIADPVFTSRETIILKTRSIT